MVLVVLAVRRLLNNRRLTSNRSIRAIRSIRFLSARKVRGRWGRGESLGSTPPNGVSFVFHPADGRVENNGDLGGYSSPEPMPGATPTKPIGLCFIGTVPSGPIKIDRIDRCDRFDPPGPIKQTKTTNRSIRSIRPIRIYRPGRSGADGVGAKASTPPLPIGFLLFSTRPMAGQKTKET